MVGHLATPQFLILSVACVDETGCVGICLSCPTMGRHERPLGLHLGEESVLGIWVSSRTSLDVGREGVHSRCSLTFKAPVAFEGVIKVAFRWLGKQVLERGWNAGEGVWEKSRWNPPFSCSRMHSR